MQITTVDKFQGQQNDFILLSLVRTRTVGHLRDVRRLIVAMSRARLGLYVFCRASLFAQCYELQPTFSQLLRRPDRLALRLDERLMHCNRRASGGNEEADVQAALVGARVVEGVEDMARIVDWRLHQHMEEQQLVSEKPIGCCGSKSILFMVSVANSVVRLPFLASAGARCSTADGRGVRVDAVFFWQHFSLCASHCCTGGRPLAQRSALQCCNGLLFTFYHPQRISCLAHVFFRKHLEC